MSLLCAHKLARLQAIVAERAIWTEQLAQVKRLHVWFILISGAFIPDNLSILA